MTETKEKIERNYFKLKYPIRPTVYYFFKQFKNDPSKSKISAYTFFLFETLTYRTQQVKTYINLLEIIQFKRTF